MLSVVIPARNAGRTLRAQLDALAGQTYRGAWELIVADNGSTDATRAVAEQSGDRLPLTVVDAGNLIGSNHARNVGTSAATGDFVLFVDADDIVAPNWLEAMARAIDGTDAVGGFLERTRFLPKDACLPGNERSDTLQPWPGFLPYPIGANCGVRTEVLRSLGGFDETYNAGGDEVELFWRLQLAGYRLSFVSDAIVWYRERATLRQVTRQYCGYGFQDPHLFRDFAELGMPSRGLLDGISSWAHLLLFAPWYFLDPARRRQWVASASRRVGRIAGSVRYRTLYL
jgi:glycosyltransferase involved in cell wall biosynthesis